MNTMLGMGGKTMEATLVIDVIKIVVTILSLFFLYLFRRKIVKFLSDAFVGGDTSRYQEESIQDIRERIERMMQEVLR